MEDTVWYTIYKIAVQLYNMYAVCVGLVNLNIPMPVEHVHSLVISDVSCQYIQIYQYFSEVSLH